MKHKRYIREVSRRKLYKDSEIVQRLTKILELNLSQSSFIYFFKKVSSSYICSNSFKSQIRNFCIYSGRSRAVLRYWKVSRIVFRELSAKGYFFGMKKASW